MAAIAFVDLVPGLRQCFFLKITSPMNSYDEY